MKKLWISFLTTLLAYGALAQNTAEPPAPRLSIPDKNVFEIGLMLDQQVQEWNRGNIEGYMHGYWQSDSLLFIGAKGPRYGYDATLKRYKEAYPDADHMGRLTSTVTSIQKLSPEYYFVVGKWALARKAGDIDGSYTLLLRRINGQWVIICDHSS